MISSIQTNCHLATVVKPGRGTFTSDQVYLSVCSLERCYDVCFGMSHIYFWLMGTTLWLMLAAVAAEFYTALLCYKMHVFGD